MRTFGTRLKFLRKTKKMTINDLATVCGCSAGLISDLENDKRSPTLDTVYHFCSALNVSVDYFVSEENVQHVHTSQTDYQVVYLTKDTKYELLTPQSYRLRALRITWLPTNREYNTFSWGHNTDEIGIVVQGKIEIQETDMQGTVTSHIVSAGETFYQRAHFNHSVKCISNDPCISYWFFSCSMDLDAKSINH